MKDSMLPNPEQPEFYMYFLNFQMKKKAPPTAAEKEEAEKLKIEGNELMRSEDFPGAIEKYAK